MPTVEAWQVRKVGWVYLLSMRALVLLVLVGVQIPLAKLVPVATVAIGGSPDWIAIDEDVWVSNKPKNIVTRIDPKTNTIAQDD